MEQPLPKTRHGEGSKFFMSRSTPNKALPKNKRKVKAGNYLKQRCHFGASSPSLRWDLKSAAPMLTAKL